MARKRIADLLKEEVNKTAESENGTKATAKADNSAKANTAKQPTSTAVNGTGSNGTAKKSPSTRQGRLTKADLEAMVADLKAQLEAAQTTEVDQEEKAELERSLQEVDGLKAELTTAKKTIKRLETQIKSKTTNAQTLRAKAKSLQSDLDEEKATVKSLRQELKQVDTLKADLAQAKEQIEQLSNAKLAPRQGVALPTRPPTSRSAPLSLKKSDRKPTSTAELSKRPDKFLSTDSKFKRIRKASIDYDKPDNKLSDNEIGWFD